MSTALPKKLSSSSPSMPLGQRAGRSFLWKETRQIATIFVAFAMLLIVLIALFENTKRLEPEITDPKGWFVIIWTAFDMFALAVGLTLFAPEKENKTVGLLQTLPVSSRFVVSQKLKIGFFSLVGFAVFGCLVQSVDFFIHGTGIYFEDMTFSVEWSRYGQLLPLVLLPIDCFLYGAFCSLVLKRTLVAALASLVVIVLTYLVPQQILQWLFEFRLDEPNSFLASFLQLKLFLYAAVGLFIFRSSSNWLRHEIWPTFSIAGIKTSGTSKNAPSRSVRMINEAIQRKTTTLPSGTIYRSLLWQTSRQYVPVAICLALTFVFYFLAAYLASIFSNRQVSFTDALHGMFEGGLTAICAVICLIMGWLTFSADQRNYSYRFFQQHGEYPRKLWFVRLIPGLAVTTICFFLTSWVFGSDMFFKSNYILLQLATLFCVAATFTFLPFAICQLNSLLHRSIVFSITSSLMMLGIIAAIGFTIVRLDDYSAMWFYPFFIVAPFAISWWWAPRWLAGRSSVKHIIIPKIALFFAGAILFTGFMYWRVAEVPRVQLNIDDQNVWYQRTISSYSESPTTCLFEAAQAINMYHSGIVPIDTLIVSEQNQSRIEEFIDANKVALAKLEHYDGTDQPLLDPIGIEQRGDQFSKISMLIAAEAQWAEKNGDLELALSHWLKLLKLEEQYPLSNHRQNAVAGLIRWGDKKGQTQELLKAALQKVQFTESSWNAFCYQTICVHKLELENWLAATKTSWHKRWIEEGFDADQAQPAFGVINGRTEYRIPFWWTPWEQERARRVAHQLIDRLSEKFQDVTPLAIKHEGSYLRGFFDQNARYAWWSVSHDKPAYFNTPSAFFLAGYEKPQEAAMLLDAIQKRRYLQVRLALAGWKLKHKRYPEKLSELAPEYFYRVPVDVVYGESFAYSGDGVNQRVGWPSPWLTTYQHEQRQIERFNFHLNGSSMIPENTPFLLPWSIFKKPESCEIMDPSQSTTITIVNYSGLQEMWQLGLPSERFQFDFELPLVEPLD